MAAHFVFHASFFGLYPGSGLSGIRMRGLVGCLGTRHVFSAEDVIPNRERGAVIIVEFGVVNVVVP